MALLFALALGLSISQGLAAESFEARIKALEPAIGHYPADFKVMSKEAVQGQYETLKRDLDAALAVHPHDESLLAQRGYLQSLGHNFDVPGAWEGATQDLTAALKINPRDISAILNLANLWVNSRPDLAKSAEGLYRAAQCNFGGEPLEEAQRGLFFTLHYQGRIKDAYAQALYLAKTWPGVEPYKRFVDMERSVVSRKGETPPDPPAKFTLPPCQAD